MIDAHLRDLERACAERPDDPDAWARYGAARARLRSDALPSVERLRAAYARCDWSIEFMTWPSEWVRFGSARGRAAYLAARAGAYFARLLEPWDRERRYAAASPAGAPWPLGDEP